MNLNNLKTGKRITLGFAAVLTIILTLSLLSYWSLVPKQAHWGVEVAGPTSLAKLRTGNLVLARLAHRIAVSGGCHTACAGPQSSLQPLFRRA